MKSARFIRAASRALMLLAIAAAPTLAAQPAKPSVPTPPPIRDRGYVLVKDWDFGKTIKTDAQMRREFFTRYVYSDGTCDTLSGNQEWERYRDNDNHRIVGGALQLVAHVRGGLTPGGIESGMLRSKWTGKYGYYECRMKVPKGLGLWPAFWLNPQDQTWPPEIDVMEIVDNGRDTTKNSFHAVHPGKADAAETIITKLDQWGSYRPGFDYADGFHVFSVEWTPDTVRHYVDNVLVAERRFHWKHDDGSDGGAAHVLVNLAVGGSWPGPPTPETQFPAILSVDYIRVWQKAS